MKVAKHFMIHYVDFNKNSPYKIDTYPKLEECKRTKWRKANRRIV